MSDKNDLLIVLLRIPETLMHGKQFSKFCKQVKAAQKRGRSTVAIENAVYRHGESFAFALWTKKDVLAHCGLLQLVYRKDVAKLQQIWLSFLDICAPTAAASTASNAQKFFVRSSNATNIRRVKHLLCECTEEEATMANKWFSALVYSAQHIISAWKRGEEDTPLVE